MYCVHCGVELEEHTTACPLCHTPVFSCQNPSTDIPNRDAALPPLGSAERRFAAQILLSLLMVFSALCFALNLIINPQFLWSLYPIGALFLLGIFLALPLLCSLSPAWYLLFDGMGVLLYLYLISILCGDPSWYLPLAFPIVILFTLLLCILVATCSKRRRFAFFFVLLLGSSLFCIGLELIIHLYLENHLYLSWSLIVLLSLSALMASGLILRRSRRLRCQLARRLHF